MIAEFCDKHKGVRRILVAFVVAWITACVGVGLYRLTELSGYSVSFLTAVVGLLQVPLAFYFQTRGKEDRNG